MMGFDISFDKSFEIEIEIEIQRRIVVTVCGIYSIAFYLTGNV